MGQFDIAGLNQEHALSLDVGAFGWHATIFLGRWLVLFAGFAVAVVAVVIFKIVYGAD